MYYWCWIDKNYELYILYSAIAHVIVSKWRDNFRGMKINGIKFAQVFSSFEYIFFKSSRFWVETIVEERTEFDPPQNCHVRTCVSLLDIPCHAMPTMDCQHTQHALPTTMPSKGLLRATLVGQAGIVTYPYTHTHICMQSSASPAHPSAHNTRANDSREDVHNIASADMLVRESRTVSPHTTCWITRYKIHPTSGLPLTPCERTRPRRAHWLILSDCAHLHWWWC